MITNLLQTLLGLLGLLVMTLSVLTPPLHTQALPITSKPIESTAENLAWQAWLMLPPEQKNLEKSRKVTPKSIFTLPFRECPPGHQLFQMRCIPTVNIDQTALLTQQLLGFVVGDGNGGDDNTNNNYDFDYEDGEEEIVMYEPPQKLSGEGSGGASNTATFSGNYDDAAQLPAKDEPFKFNFFQQKFPTDYEGSDGVSSAQLDGDAKLPDTRSNTFLQGMQFLEAVKGYLERHVNETEPNKSSNGIDAFQGENTKFAISAEGSGDAATTSTSSSTGSSSTERTFSISEIDAIALPAVGVVNRTLTSVADLEPHKSHKFSLFKDDSAVQLVTTAISERKNDDETASMQPDISQLLKADALLPLLQNVNGTSAAVVESASTTTKAADNKNNNRKAETTTTSFVLTAAQSVMDEVTDMLPVDEVESSTATAMLPTDFGMLLAAAQKLQQKLQQQEHQEQQQQQQQQLQHQELQEEAQQQKIEHTRSVTISYKDATEDDLIAAPPAEFEDDVVTTTESDDATTNIQLDDTTIIEAYDPPTIAVQELLSMTPLNGQEQTTKQRTSENQVVLKKSKVEPVELVVTDLTEKTATKAAEAAPTTPLPTVAVATTSTAKTTSVVDDDRFFHQPEILADNASSDSSKQQRVRIAANGNINDADFGSRSTKKNNSGSSSDSNSDSTTSENDIAEELRMINELVKGNKRRQLATTSERATAEKKSTLTTTATTATTTATTESSLTAETEETKTNPSTASASKNKETSAIYDDIEVSTLSVDQNIDGGSSTGSSSSQSILQESAAITTPTEQPAETTATLWSKILPMLGFGTTKTQAAIKMATADGALAAAVTPISTTIPVPPAAAFTVSSNDLTTTTAAATDSFDYSVTSEAANAADSTDSASTKTSSISLSSINSNRNNRNSKISKNNKASVHDDYVSTTATTTTTTTTTTTARTPTTAVPRTTTTTTTTPTATATATSTTVAEPFWWLPMGWRLDGRDDDDDDDDADGVTETRTHPLLLRFWSAFPGSSKETKVPKN